MNLIIRQATVGDAEAIANIHIRSWEAAYAGIIPATYIKEKNAGRHAMWKNILSGGQNNNYIALHYETFEAVGLIGIHPCRDEDMQNTGEIGAVYLHPSYWRQGFGRQMIEFASERLKKLKFNIVTLWVLEDNLNARRFYEKCGFYFDGTKKEIILGKPLIELRYRKDM